jgi:hypothetical protein
MLLVIATWLSTSASIVALIVSFRPEGEPLTAYQGGFIALACVGFLAMVAIDLRARRRLSRHSLRDDAEIKRYMYRWISKGGRVSIFTRDMSWASDERISALLRQKASRAELTLVLPTRIPLAQELEKAGCEVVSYEHLGYVPQSRFTIINKDRMDAHLAVGRRIGDRHIVEEYSVGQHPVFAIANDLVEVLTHLAARAAH